MKSSIKTISITGQTSNAALIQKIIAIGKELLQKPIELLPGVEMALEQLNGHYRLVLATKEDLLDQERKLKSLDEILNHPFT